MLHEWGELRQAGSGQLRPFKNSPVAGQLRFSNAARADCQKMNDEYIGQEAALKASQMTRLGTDASGWDTYLRDDQSGEYWLLYYPQSYQHGGGTVHLKRTTAAAFMSMRTPRAE